MPFEKRAKAEAEVASFEEFKKLAREHPRKSDDEIWAMVHQGRAA
jgi:hypothetical protein